jgi:hypothetical protein
MSDVIRAAPARRRALHVAPLCGALAAFLTATAVQAAPQQAGVSAAVRGEVSRSSTLEADTPEAAHKLQVGSEVFMQDRVSSGEESRAQILLLDESTFKLGPKSDLVIDEFVYDPESGTGELVANAAVGTFRFVSGQIGQRDAESVQIETPAATMGVRGTIAIGSITRGPDGEVEEAQFVLSGPGIENNANARRGAIQVTAAGETVTVQRTGWGTTVVPGEPPSPPAPVPTAVLRELDSQLSNSAEAGDAPGADPSGGSLTQLGATQLSGQNVAESQDESESTQQTKEAESHAQQLASGEELEDLKVTPAAEEAGLIDGADFAFLDNPLQTFEALNDVGFGMAQASQTGVSLFDTQDFDTSTEISELSSLTDLGLEEVGTYDVSFQANFATATFRAVFDNINVPNREISGGELLQDSAFPASGSAILFFAASGAGSDGIEANTVCAAADCVGLLALFEGDNEAIGGILHGLGVDETIIGVGAAPTD